MAGWYEFALSGAVQTVEFAAANMTSTSHFELPAGTTAQRPGTPVEGDTRYNATDKRFEVYCGATDGWVQLSPGAGASTFLALSDTPATYSGAAGMLTRVNVGANGLEFVNFADLTIFGTTFDDSDRLMLEDDSDTNPVPKQVRAGDLFTAYGLAKTLNGPSTHIGSNSTDYIEFKAVAGGQDVIFKCTDENGNSIFEVKGDANEHVKIAPGDFFELAGVGQRFDEITAPSTPATGKVIVYAKTDGKMYQKNDAGTETALGGGGLFLGTWNVISGKALEQHFDDGAAGQWGDTATFEQGLGEGVISDLTLAGEAGQDFQRRITYLIPLPPKMASDVGTLKLAVRAKLSAATNGTSQIDCVVHDGVGEGETAGSDLCTTAAQTVTTTWGWKKFEITDTNLADADIGVVRLVLRINDTGGGTSATMRINAVAWELS